MRVVPTFQHTCHVCRSAFTVHNRMEVRAGAVRVRQEPKACPSCDARLAFAPRLDVGLAKGLLLLATGAPAEEREYGTPEAYLKRYCLTVEAVDALLQLARAMDYDAWEKMIAKLLPHDRRYRGEARRLPKIRRAAEHGDLLERLGEAAERVKRRLRARDARHLAIFAARREAGGATE